MSAELKTEFVADRFGLPENVLVSNRTSGVYWDGSKVLAGVPNVFEFDSHTRSYRYQSPMNSAAPPGRTLVTFGRDVLLYMNVDGGLERWDRKTLRKIDDLVISDGWKSDWFSCSTEPAPESRTIIMLVRPAADGAELGFVSYSGAGPVSDVKTLDYRFPSRYSDPYASGPQFNGQKILLGLGTGRVTNSVAVFELETGAKIIEKTTGGLHQLGGNYLASRVSGSDRLEITSLDTKQVITTIPTVRQDNYSDRTSFVVVGDLLWLLDDYNSSTNEMRYRRFDMSSSSSPRLVDEFQWNSFGHDPYRFQRFGPDFVIRINSDWSLSLYDFSTTSTNRMPIVRASAEPVWESDGQMTAKITLSQPAQTQTSVRLTTRSSTAKVGEDFALVDQVVVFPPGVIERSVAIPILEDSHLETNESFELQLHETAGLRVASGIFPAVIHGNGLGEWVADLSTFPVEPAAGIIKASIPQYIGSTDDMIVVLLPHDARYPNKPAVYDRRSNTLLKVINSEFIYYTAYRLNGAKLRCYYQLNGQLTYRVINLQTGLVEKDISTEMAWPADMRNVQPIDDDRAFYRADDGYVIANFSNPMLTQRIPVPVGATDSGVPSLNNGQMLVPFVIWDPQRFVNQHWVAFLDLNTLQESLRFKVPEIISRTDIYLYGYMAAAYVDERTIVLRQDRRLFGMDLESGELLWSESIGQSIYGVLSPLQFKRGFVYVTEDNPRSKFSLRDVRTGVVLEDSTAQMNGSYSVRYNMVPTATGWSGGSDRSAYGLSLEPSWPILRFLPEVSVSEIGVMEVSLQARERFAGTLKLSAREVLGTSSLANDQPKFESLPAEISLSWGNPGGRVGLRPIDDVLFRPDPRASTIKLFSTDASQELLGSFRATVIEDEEVAQGTSIDMADQQVVGGNLLLVSERWIVVPSELGVHVIDRKTKLLIRSFATEIPLGPSAAISGDLLLLAVTRKEHGPTGAPSTWGGKVRLYSLLDGSLRASFQNTDQMELLGDSAAINEKWLVIGTTRIKGVFGDNAGGVVSVYDLKTMKRILLKRSSVPGFGQAVVLSGDQLYVGAYGGSVRPRGKAAVTCGAVQVFDLPKGRALPPILPPQLVSGMRFGMELKSADGMLAVKAPYFPGPSWDKKGALFLYDFQTRSLKFSAVPSKNGGYENDFMLISKNLAAFGNSNLTVIELPTGQRLRSLVILAQVNSVSELITAMALHDAELFWITTAGRVNWMPLIESAPSALAKSGRFSSSPAWYESRLSGLKSSVSSDQSPDADGDLDGLANWQEMLLGLDPTNPAGASPLFLTSERIMTVRYFRPLESGGRYFIHPEFSSDLASWQRLLPDGVAQKSLGVDGGLEQMELKLDLSKARQRWIRFSFQ